MEVNIPTILRSQMIQEDAVVFSIPLINWKKTADGADLPTAGDGTNLAYVAGVHGTNSPQLKSTVANTNVITEKARCSYILPDSYVAGQTVTFRINLEMAAAANPTQTIDLECYKSDRKGGIGADICADAAQAFTNSRVDYDFTITPTGLVRGDVLDLEITAVIDDSGGPTGGPQQAIIGATEMLLDIKG